jgi:hypothetical protein
MIRLKYQTLPNLKVWTPMRDDMALSRKGLEVIPFAQAKDWYHRQCQTNRSQQFYKATVRLRYVAIIRYRIPSCRNPASLTNPHRNNQMGWFKKCPSS